MSFEHLIRPKGDTGVMVNTDPTDAGWDHLDFAVIRLEAGQTYGHATAGREVAIVVLAGAASVEVAGVAFPLQRASVFEEPATVLYVPPGNELIVTATERCEFSLGGAPAEGRYPVRRFTIDDMHIERRGGGAATRQVNHILAHPLPAERLILFEVYVPRGGWSGWPPHCHDGYAGSPYLEETYWFRLDPADGFAVHRNYRLDTDFNEVLPVHDGDLVLVTQGFHSSVAAPGSNMYFLNYLAGELLDEARATPPFFQPEYRWIEGRWKEGLMTFPAGGVRP
jgi:5-deoxy-glucuronate isomerase